MAIDDNTNYTLTGAQVKDLAARIKASGGGMIVYVDASFESPSSITNVFSDSGLTTVADWEDMADVILAGGTVIAVYDNGSNKHQYVELVSVTVNDNIPFGKRFAGVISSNVGEGSKPLTIFLYYDDGIVTPRWFAEGSSIPTVNDATLTIQHNGTNVQTFTANQSTNATANIETIWADTITPTTAVATIGTTQIADGAVTSAKVGALETVNLSDYITAKSGFTFTDDGCRRFGKIVILNFTVAGTIGTGETNVGTCSNRFSIDFFGAGRTAAWNQTNRPANIMMISGGDARIYSVASNTSAAFTVVLFEN